MFHHALACCATAAAIRLKCLPPPRGTPHKELICSQEVNSSQLAAQEGTQQMRACHHPPYTSSPSTTVTLKDVEPQLQDESSKVSEVCCFIAWYACFATQQGSTLLVLLTNGMVICYFHSTQLTACASTIAFGVNICTVIDCRRLASGSNSLH